MPRSREPIGNRSAIFWDPSGILDKMSVVIDGFLGGFIFLCMVFSDCTSFTYFQVVPLWSPNEMTEAGGASFWGTQFFYPGFFPKIHHGEFLRKILPDSSHRPPFPFLFPLSVRLSGTNSPKLCIVISGFACFPLIRSSGAVSELKMAAFSTNPVAKLHLFRAGAAGRS